MMHYLMYDDGDRRPKEMNECSRVKGEKTINMCIYLQTTFNLYPTCIVIFDLKTYKPTYNMQQFAEMTISHIEKITHFL